MNIGLNLINFSSNQIDGVGYYVKRIIYTLNQINHNYKFIVLIPENFDISILDLNETDYYIYKFDVPENKILRVMYKFIYYPFLLKKINLDLIYSPAPPISPFISKKTKIVTSILDITAIKFDRGQGFIYKYYYWLILKIAIYKSDYLTTISHNSLKDITSLFPCAAKKISIISCFVTEKKYQQFPDCNNFIFVSTIQPGKNIERLIEAFSIFKSERSDDFKLFIIGRFGWGSDDILRLPLKYGIEKSVVFTGYVDEKTLSYYYENCASLIYPSLYEGFGLPPLEAMYYGKPSVVSDSSSLPEVVGGAGLLVDPMDAHSIALGMRDIMNKEIRTTILKNIPKQLAKFDPEVQVTNLLKVFEMNKRVYK